MKTCRHCGSTKIRPSRIRKKDYICNSCDAGKEYRAYKGTYCIICGPDIEYHPVQLDVDHIDGNKNNNTIDNLQTLCANCHRLKTHENLDYL